MTIKKWICVLAFLLAPNAFALSADDTNQPPVSATNQPQAPECNSCTRRHQALLRKKKERERKARAAAEKKTDQ